MRVKQTFGLYCPPSIRVLIAPDDGDGFGDDHEVEYQRPVAHVVDVVLDAGAHLVEGFGFAAQAVDLSGLSTNLDDCLAFRQQIHGSSARAGEHCLQTSIGDVAAGHPKQLGRRTKSGYQFHKVTIFADQYNAGLSGLMEYVEIGRIPQAQITQGIASTETQLPTTLPVVAAIAHQPRISRRQPYDVCPARSKLQAGENVFPLKVREIRQHFFHAHTLAQHFKDVVYTDAHASDAGTPAALSSLDRNPFQQACVHGMSF